mmetsp:Transcript_5952/g.15491  ORF Transcript_5952/g.15491 Transcript_5952/m.15491 type:complete len:181 (+) Transcript_5952:75-617(+)
MKKLRDPTKLRRFPYETRVPETPTYWLIVMSPAEYGETPIGSYIFRSSADSDDGANPTSSEFYKEIDAIYEDMAYRPRLGTRIGLAMSSLIMYVPDGLHELFFEEILVILILSSNLLSRLPSGLGDPSGDQSESLAMAFIIIAFLLIACVISGLMAFINILEHFCMTAAARSRSRGADAS